MAFPQDASIHYNNLPPRTLLSGSDIVDAEDQFTASAVLSEHLAVEQSAGKPIAGANPTKLAKSVCSKQRRRMTASTLARRHLMAGDQFMNPSPFLAKVPQLRRPVLATAGAGGPAFPIFRDYILPNLFPVSPRPGCPPPV